MAYAHRDLCAISGIGASDYSANSGRSVLSLAATAALAAVDDAGLAARDIDGASDSFYDGLYDLEWPFKAWDSGIGSSEVA